MGGEAVHGRFACRGVQRQVRRGRRRLHEQGLGQLALVLLDLLLQVSDCARNLVAEMRVGKGSKVAPITCLQTQGIRSPLAGPTAPKLRCP